MSVACFLFSEEFNTTVPVSVYYIAQLHKYYYRSQVISVIKNPSTNTTYSSYYNSIVIVIFSFDKLELTGVAI